jgi:hypothetical protein
VIVQTEQQACVKKKKQMPVANLNDLRVVDLRKIARLRRVPYYYRMTKADLVRNLEVVLAARSLQRLVRQHRRDDRERLVASPTTTAAATRAQHCDC